MKGAESYLEGAEKALAAVRGGLAEIKARSEERRVGKEC